MRSSSSLPGIFAASTLVVLAGVACSTSGRQNGQFEDPTDPSNTGSIAGGDPGSGGIGNDDSNPLPDACAQAKTTKSYVGCDYWPTVTANSVWSIFDYAVVVANNGTTAADLKVTGPGGFTKDTTVPPGELKKIYLPWVKELKGPDANASGGATPMESSVLVRGGAYHLVSSSPVVVYQFNALEYKGVGGETPDGKTKDWSACPSRSDCFSYSNDASLLLPSTAMSGNYRITGIHGWSESSLFGNSDVMGGYFTVTATENDTEISVKLSETSKVLAGGGIPATAANGTLTLKLNAGDVAEVVGALGEKFDLSGSLLKANKPVQVITGIPCINLPKGKQACDHVEETVIPVETLGKRYVLTVPTSPNGKPVMHIVRLYGNADDTHLTYAPSKPAGCPDTLKAGQVADCGSVTADIDITGDHEFAVSSFQVGAAALANDPLGLSNQQGDPSQSSFASVEQFRTQYLFLAPSDYDVGYADIVGPADAEIVLDGNAVSGFTAIGTGGMGTYRVKLGGSSGTHTLTAKKPVGVQVIGYGANTSYQYPGGLDLKRIAEPPVK